jgi:NADH-quinone oxidoreductase subunit K
VIRLFIALELMILSVNLLFVHAAFCYADIRLAPQVVVPVVLAVAACEATVGLGLLVVAYRAKGTIELGSLNKLRG